MKIHLNPYQILSKTNPQNNLNLPISSYLTISSSGMMVKLTPVTLATSHWEYAYFCPDCFIWEKLCCCLFCFESLIFYLPYQELQETRRDIKFSKKKEINFFVFPKKKIVIKKGGRRRIGGFQYQLNIFFSLLIS